MFPTMKPLRTLVLALLLGVALGLSPPAARADQNDPNLERLFAELRKTDDKLLALRIEAEIWRTWHVSGSATVDLLMQRGLVAMSANKFDEAYTHLSSVVELAPEFSEGWNKRATVLFLMQRYEDSMRVSESPGHRLRKVLARDFSKSRPVIPESPGQHHGAI